MKPYEILARTYDLLASASSEDFRKAGRAAEQTELQEVMDRLALAKEAIDLLVASSQSTGRSRKKPPQASSTLSEEASRREKLRRPILTSNGQLTHKEESQIRQLAGDARIFPSNRELVEKLNEMGLDRRFSPKDGRDRTVEKLVDCLRRRESRQERNTLLAALFSHLPESQTSGWFRVIGEGRR